VSDVRITWWAPNTPSKKEDIARKCIFYDATDGRFAVAYTGNALSLVESKGSKPIWIEDWLFRELADVSSNGLLPTVSAITMRLQEVVHATELFWPGQLGADPIRVTILFTGFFYNSPFPTLASISNFDKLGHRIMSVPIGNAPLRPISKETVNIPPVTVHGSFSAYVAGYEEPHYRIVAHGDLASMTQPIALSLHRRIRAIREKGRTWSHITSALVEALRSCAEGSPSHSISKDCWSYHISSNDISTVDYDAHFEQSRATVISPRAVMLGWQIDGLHVTVPTTEESVEIYKQRILAGETDIELNLDSLRAYIQVSSALENWVGFMHSLGVSSNEPDLTDTGEADRVAALAKKIGVIHVSGIDRLLNASTDWQRELLRRYVTHSEEHYASLLVGGNYRGGLLINRAILIALLLIGSYPEILTTVALNSDFGWHDLDHFVIAARELNPKFNR
jgi:hypothetical protein